MAIGTSVFRIRIELIFRWCWNLITPLAGERLGDHFAGSPTKLKPAWLTPGVFLARRAPFLASM